MTTTAAPNHRASLLSGLRTGGVRSASGPMAIPHTAAPSGTFNIPRVMSSSYANGSHYPEESDGFMGQQAAATYAAPKRYQPPMTAAVDGSNNRFLQQQAAAAAAAQSVMQGAMPVSPAFGGSPQAQAQAQMQAQALQMQMMQMEIMRLQVGRIPRRLEDSRLMLTFPLTYRRCRRSSTRPRLWRRLSASRTRRTACAA
jgi:hypothetical protein